MEKQISNQPSQDLRVASQSATSLTLSTANSKSWNWAGEAFEFASELKCLDCISEVDAVLSETCDGQLARDAVGIVMSLYPPRDMADPEAFLEYAVHSLVGLPSAAVLRMAHPQHGIARTCKFLPSIAEMVQWCEGEVAGLKAAQAKAQRRMAIWRERQRTQDLLNGEVVRERIPDDGDAQQLAEKRTKFVEKTLGDWLKRPEPQIAPPVAREWTYAEIESGKRLAASVQRQRDAAE